MNFRIAESARIEFVESASWYDSRQTGLGRDFVNEVETAFQICRDRPQSCPAAEHYRGRRDIRRVRVRRFPYQVLFQIADDELRVIAIAHFSRRPLYWVDRLG